jgi:hypothetical protein
VVLVDAHRLVLSGVALVIVGIVLLIVARSMKPEKGLEGRSKYQ